MNGFTITCVKCDLDAPELGRAGYLGTPSLSADPKSYRHRDSDRDLTFGYFYEALAALGLHVDEVEGVREFLETHRRHDVVLYSDAQDEASLPKGLQRLLRRRERREEAGTDEPRPEAKPPAGEFVVAAFVVACEECGKEHISEQPASLLRIEPRPLTRETVALVLERWKRSPDDGWNADLPALIDPYGGAMPKLLRFLEVHRGHPIQSRLNVQTPKAPGPASADFYRPEEAGVRVDRIKSFKVPGISDRIEGIVADDEGLFVSADDRIHAYDLRDYSERWAIKSARRWWGYGVLRFVAGTLIGGTRTNGDKICGIDPRTGKTLWEMSAPLGRVDVFGSELLVRVPDKPEVRRVDPRTGRLLESIALPGTWGLVFGETLVFHGKDATLTGFDIATRKTLWSCQYTPVTDANGDSDDRILGGSAEAGVFVFRLGRELQCRDLRSGTIAWRVRLGPAAQWMEMVFSPASFFKDVALVEARPLTPSRNPMVDAGVATCIELRTGRVRWQRRNSELGWSTLSAVRALGHDFVLGVYSKLLVVSASDGRTVLEAESPTTAFLGSVWRDLLFLRGERGRLDVLRAFVVTEDAAKKPGKRAGLRKEEK